MLLKLEVLEAIRRSRSSRKGAARFAVRAILTAINFGILVDGSYAASLLIPGCPNQPILYSDDFVFVEKTALSGQVLHTDRVEMLSKSTVLYYFFVSGFDQLSVIQGHATEEYIDVTEQVYRERTGRELPAQIRDAVSDVIPFDPMMVSEIDGTMVRSVVRGDRFVFSAGDMFVRGGEEGKRINMGFWAARFGACIAQGQYIAMLPESIEKTEANVRVIISDMIGVPRQ